MTSWFITGASRGFGHEVAAEALRRGDTVVATARHEGALDSLKQFGEDHLFTHTLDVTKPDQITQVAATAEAETGGIDVLFNNAGIGYFAAFEESEDAELRRMVEINIFGLASVTKAILPFMRLRRSGTIINMSSVGGVRSFPAVSWYNATKFAVEGLSESIALETTPLGIRMIIVEPSAFATDWAGSSAAEVKPADVIADYDQTAGEQRRTFRKETGHEPGDPARAAVVIVDAAHDAKPPLRLPVGNYAYDGLLEKLDSVRVDVAPREALSRSADRATA